MHKDPAPNGGLKIPSKGANGFTLPILGLGTWQMGGREMHNPSNDDRRDIQGIRAAIDAGITHLDTAEVYAAGFAERFVGEAIQGYDRSRLFITTKVHAGHLHYDDVIAACHASLSRLGIAQLDLYLVHHPNPEISLQETMRAMDFLRENELTRYIGVSNFDIPLLEEAMAYTKYHVVSNQIHYSLVARAYEENGTLEFCRQHGILVTAYRPIGRSGELAQRGNTLLDEVAQKYGKTPAQVAINWVMQKPNVITLFKTSDPAHLEENLGALGWRLSASDERRLDENFPPGITINLPGEG
ncbi:MAG: aldo/keto reductase [Patescibacteria group bacterium]|nr:aldo/keto reductase [Patescibacteria group bacterium]